MLLFSKTITSRRGQLTRQIEPNKMRITRIFTAIVLNSPRVSTRSPTASFYLGAKSGIGSHFQGPRRQAWPIAISAPPGVQALERQGDADQGLCGNSFGQR